MMWGNHAQASSWRLRIQIKMAGLANGCRHACTGSTEPDSSSVVPFAPRPSPSATLMFVVVAVSFFFEKLLKELFHFRASLFQRLLSWAGREVNLAAPALDLHVLRPQPPALFETMEQGIHRSGPDLVAMPPQFFDHAKAEDTFRTRVVQHVDADESREDFGVSCNSFRRQSFPLLVSKH
jgi:hypothetical protein